MPQTRKLPGSRNVRGRERERGRACEQEAGGGESGTWRKTWSSVEGLSSRCSAPEHTWNFHTHSFAPKKVRWRIVLQMFKNLQAKGFNSKDFGRVSRVRQTLFEDFVIRFQLMTWRVSQEMRHREHSDASVLQPHPGTCSAETKLDHQTGFGP